MPQTYFEQIAHVLGVFALVLLLARIAGNASKRAGLPSVLGELCLGIALGPSLVYGRPEESMSWNLLGEIGVLLLLFEVGLESRIGELRRVGKQSLAVACLGVVLPILLVAGFAWTAGAVSSLGACLFLGATVSATSVGITARVLRDLGQSHSREAKIILGAAVIDDILALLLLALATGLARTGLTNLNLLSVFVTVLKAVGFLVLAILVGKHLLHRLFRWTAGLLGQGAVLTTGLSVCFAYGWAAHAFGLAPAVGAFFAGLMIEPEAYAPLRSPSEGLLEARLEPLSAVFIPLFFVLTGMKVELATLANGSALLLTGALVIAAVAGKVAAGLGAGREVRRFMVGVGMIPRGEVDLIFASLGAGLLIGGQPLLPPTVFAAAVTAIAATSIVAPVWLGILLRNGSIRENVK